MNDGYTDMEKDLPTN